MNCSECVKGTLSIIGSYWVCDKCDAVLKFLRPQWLPSVFQHIVVVRSPFNPSSVLRYSNGHYYYMYCNNNVMMTFDGSTPKKLTSNCCKEPLYYTDTLVHCSKCKIVHGVKCPTCDQSIYRQKHRQGRDCDTYAYDCNNCMLSFTGKDRCLIPFSCKSCGNILARCELSHSSHAKTEQREVAVYCYWCSKCKLVYSDYDATEQGLYSQKCYKCNWEPKYNIKPEEGEDYWYDEDEKSNKNKFGCPNCALPASKVLDLYEESYKQLWVKFSSLTSTDKNTIIALSGQQVSAYNTSLNNSRDFTISAIDDLAHQLLDIIHKYLTDAKLLNIADGLDNRKKRVVEHYLYLSNRLCYLSGSLSYASDNISKLGTLVNANSKS